MKSYEHEVYIANTLKYIHLLPEKEQKKIIRKCYKKLEVLIEKVNMIISILNLLKKPFG